MRKKLLAFSMASMILAPLTLAGPIASAAEVDSPQATSVQNISNKTGFSDEIQQMITDGDLGVDTNGNLSVTQQLVAKAKDRLVKNNLDGEFDVVAQGAALVYIDRDHLEKSGGVSKTVYTANGYDQYLTHAQVNKLATQSDDNWFLGLLPGIGALATGVNAYTTSMQKADHGNGVILHMYSRFGLEYITSISSQ